MSGDYFSDPSFLATMLVAIVKKNGNEVTMSEEDVAKVKTGDKITLKYDKENGKITLECQASETDLQSLTDIYAKSKALTEK